VDPDARIEDVSVGVQQRVEILKALYRGADVLILDEPTAVLTPQEVEDLYGVFEELTEQGKTIIFISHKLGEALSAADEITVLRDGVNVGTVASADVTREDLAEMMVGREVLMEPATTPQKPGDRVLEVTEVHADDDRGVETVSGISFELRAGEVFGIAGVDGNGQSQLVETITGMHNPTDGSITYLGEPMADESRREHIDRGMAFIPEDRQERGLVMSYDLTENGILGSQHDPPFAEGGRLDWRASRDHAESVIEQYDVRPRTPTPRRNRSLAATSRSSSSAGSSSAIRNWSWRCTRRGGRHRLHGVPPRPPARTADRGEGGASGLLEVRRSTGALRPARRDPRGRVHWSRRPRHGDRRGNRPADGGRDARRRLRRGAAVHNAGPDPVGNGGVETDTGTDDTLEKTDDDIENEEVDA